MTNDQLVADALVSAEAAMPDAADEIFLVSTSIIDKWGISCLRRAEKTYDQEIDPATLIGPTKR